MRIGFELDSNDVSKYVLGGDPETEELLGVTVMDPGLMKRIGLEKGKHYASKALTDYGLDEYAVLEGQLEAGHTLTDYELEDYEVVELDESHMADLFDEIRSGDPEELLLEVDDELEPRDIDGFESASSDVPESGYSDEMSDSVKARKKSRILDHKESPVRKDNE